MKTPGAVLLLLWSGLVVVAGVGKDLQDKTAATASTQQTCQPDIYTVLREMSALMVEQRVELRCTQTQIEAMETRLTERLDASENEAETRLRASENKAETMETRLRASENRVEEQRAVIKELKEKQEEQAAALRAVGGSVNLTGSQVEELRREREERRVSFSASLVASGGENFGPFSKPTTLIYRHVITNTGNAYNPNTGVFRAPVRGVYYFAVIAHGLGHASTPTGVSLHKNEEHVVIAYGHQPSHRVDTSNGASLLLEVGDVVYVKLWPNAWVLDSYNHHTTFSGHLLFPM
ncbi:complement C1q-like protein 2 isoform X2 [Clupea harengus]|uniref:Complement C1q-like protein 2 isoform X2 n=1 Tax=Clupea harengus TaxID=7950 RepID=A0A8M1KNT2_CLUHA|nr:complement C1q-like protein 2 isoform X2 [Clupea harengus]